MTVITSDDTDGFAYLNPNEIDIIAPGVTISQPTFGFAIASTFSQSQLFNFGSVIATNFGVNFTGNSAVHLQCASRVNRRA